MFLKESIKIKQKILFSFKESLIFSKHSLFSLQECIMTQKQKYLRQVYSLIFSKKSNKR